MNGYLLDKTDVHRLIESDIIVECHDFLWPHDQVPLSKAISERFSDTHDIEWIAQEIPYPGDYPWLHDMPVGTVLLAITEKRPSPTVWLACWTRTGRS